MNKYDWSRLNHLQVGKYAEYLAKMEFTLHGFDVYTTEVDNRGIDFLVRKDHATYYDIQVKSIRKSGYIFFPKSTFTLRPNLLAAIVLFLPLKIPQLYLIPSTAWLSPNPLLVGHDYEGKKSPPEWGINLSSRHIHLLEPFAFDTAVLDL